MTPESYKEILNFVRAKWKETKHKKNAYSVMVETLRRKLIVEGEKCKRCGTDKDLTLDHIIPVSFLESLMLDVEDLFDEENIDLLCHKCNKFKADRIDLSHPKTKYLLLKFVNKL